MGFPSAVAVSIRRTMDRRLTFRIDEKAAEALDLLAQTNRNSTSAELRRAVQAHLNAAATVVAGAATRRPDDAR